MARLEAKNRAIAIIFFIVSFVVIPTSRVGAVIDLKYCRLKQTGHEVRFQIDKIE